MKNKLIVSSLAFFILVNTSYYWGSLSGLWDVGIALALLITFIYLGLILLIQIFQIFKNRFNDKRKNINVIILAVILTTTGFFPFGLINFENFEGQDLIVAQREGAANCMTTLKLKTDTRFVEKSVCFGVKRIKGTYKFSGDSVILYYPKNNENENFEFGIIHLDTNYIPNALGHFDLYKSNKDKTPLSLLIIKYELKK